MSKDGPFNSFSASYSFCVLSVDLQGFALLMQEFVFVSDANFFWRAPPCNMLYSAAFLSPKSTNKKATKISTFLILLILLGWGSSANGRTRMIIFFLKISCAELYINRRDGGRTHELVCEAAGRVYGTLGDPGCAVVVRGADLVDPVPVDSRASLWQQIVHLDYDRVSFTYLKHMFPDGRNIRAFSVSS